MRCPLCHTELPEGATSCSRCDWVQQPNLPPSRRNDWIAAGLSVVVPGLGHLYKGHLLTGVLVLCIIGPLYLLCALLLVSATYGASLFLALLFLGVTAIRAFRLKDVRQNPGAFPHARLTLERWLERVRHGGKATR